MIADAIKAQYPEAKRVTVDLQTIRYTINDTRHVHFTPEVAQRELLNFDLGLKPQPFKFRLPSPVQKVKSGRQSSRAVGRAVKTNGSGRIVKVGGRTPPSGPLGQKKGPYPGMRREFGLRSMGRFFQGNQYIEADGSPVADK